jgi:hypothetical protein
MSYRIQVGEGGKYLCVLIEGEVTYELALKHSAEVRKISLTKGIRRFLFDIRKARNTSFLAYDNAFAYKDALEMQLERNVRAAILVDPGDRSTEHDFVETTMQNAGYDVKLFSDEAAAVNWLSEEEAEHMHIIRSQRKFVNLMADYVAGGLNLPVFIGDVSEKGMHMVTFKKYTEGKLFPGNNAELKLRLSPEECIPLSCEVKWVSTDKPSYRATFDVGLEIINPPSQYISLVKSLPQNPSPLP